VERVSTRPDPSDPNAHAPLADSGTHRSIDISPRSSASGALFGDLLRLSNPIGVCLHSPRPGEERFFIVGVVGDHSAEKTRLIDCFHTFLRQDNLPKRIDSIYCFNVDQFIDLKTDEVVRDGRLAWPSVLSLFALLIPRTSLLPTPLSFVDSTAPI
jgi:hypothetical protein